MTKQEVGRMGGLCNGKNSGVVRAMQAERQRKVRGLAAQANFNLQDAEASGNDMFSSQMEQDQ